MSEETAKFHFDFPLYMVVESFTTKTGGPESITFHGPALLRDAKNPTALAVFTDLPAAEEFRDRSAPKHQIFPIQTSLDLVSVLKWSRGTASIVAFDPFRLGMQTQVATFEDLLAQFDR